jgi:hypothetical protein
MSSGQASRQRKQPAAEPRAPLFEVQHKPLPKPPRPIETVLGDVGDLPGGSRRAPRRAAPELRIAEPEPAPAEANAQAARAPGPRPAYAEMHPTYAPPPRYERPARDRLPAYETYPHWELSRVPAGGRMLILLLVALICGAVVWMYLQGPKTYISRYGAPGWSEVAGDAASKVFGSVEVPAGEHSVLGEPSITAAAIDTILARYGSPAAGTGQTWIKFGQQYGIDPAYAIAFFIHESSAGTNPGWAGIKPDGTTTHNVGNIICAGYATCYGRFRDYPSWDEGIADWYKLISTEYVNGRGAASIEQIIPIYAPSSDNNDVPRYINVVVSMVESWRRGVLE